MSRPTKKTPRLISFIALLFLTSLYVWLYDQIYLCILMQKNEERVQLEKCMYYVCTCHLHVFIFRSKCSSKYIICPERCTVYLSKRCSVFPWRWTRKCLSSNCTSPTSGNSSQYKLQVEVNRTGLILFQNCRAQVWKKCYFTGCKCLSRICDDAPYWAAECLLTTIPVSDGSYG